MSSDLSNNDFKELVRSRTDLVALIGESVALTPARGGAEFKCLCPFHDDHNPSMVVNPDRQTWRCWSCSTGGDCFSWVTEFDKVEFRDALQTLATRAGLEMPKFGGARPQENAVAKADIFDVLTWAEDEFHRCLLDSQMAAPAREYLKERGFTDETIAKFKLGFAPGDGQWLLARSRGKFAVDQMETARLVKKSDEGTGYYQFFRNRVLFPIRNDKGRCVSFGGRVLPQFAQPGVGKYINGPESDVYSKSNLLFGFDAAREGIRKAQTAVVVEGYTDVLISHQFGVTNVVGVCGTALTEAHVARLKRFAGRIVLMFDGDDAGQKAAEKALSNFLAESIDLKVLVLPEDQDPDEYLFAHGAEAYQHQIDNATEAFDFKLQTEINRHGLESIDARHRVLTSMLELLAKVSKLRGTSKEDVILSRLSGRTMLNEQVVRQRLSEMREVKSGATNAALRNGNTPAAKMPQGGPEATSRSMSAHSEPSLHKSVRMDRSGVDRGLNFSGQKMSQCDQFEYEILGIIFSAPQMLDAIRLEIGDEDFQNEQNRLLLQTCFDLSDHGELATFERIMSAIEDNNLKRLVIWVDEQARKKEIAQKLTENLMTYKEQTLPRYLVQCLQPIQWRREEQLHQRNTGRLAQQPESRAGLNSNAKALLEQQTAFHQKRAAKTSWQ